MKLVALVLISACLVIGATDKSAMIGVWRGQIDELPGVVMTISDEGRHVTGAILFYLIRRDEGQPPVASPGIPQPLMNLKVERNSLRFRVSHRRAHGAATAHDPSVNFRLRITGPGEGVLVREGNDSEAVPVRRDK